MHHVYEYCGSHVILGLGSVCASLYSRVNAVVIERPIALQIYDKIILYCVQRHAQSCMYSAPAGYYCICIIIYIMYMPLSVDNVSM